MQVKELHRNDKNRSLARTLLICSVIEKVAMLRITTETKRGKTILTVEGRIAGQSVATVEQCWRELYAASPKQKYIVNLCGVSFIDNSGKVLLREMHRLGAELQAEGCLNQAIVDEISTSDDADAAQDGKGAKKSKGASIIFYVVFFTFLLLPALANAQEKSPALPGNAPTGTLRLTLEQAVALAIKQNPTQQIAVLNAAESVQDKNITRADLLPQANLHVADSANRVNLNAEFGGKPLVPGFRLPGHIGPYKFSPPAPRSALPSSTSLSGSAIRRRAATWTPPKRTAFPPASRSFCLSFRNTSARSAQSRMSKLPDPAWNWRRLSMTRPPTSRKKA